MLSLDDGFLDAMDLRLDHGVSLHSDDARRLVAGARSLSAALRAVVSLVHVSGRFADESHDACPVCRSKPEYCPKSCPGAIGRAALGGGS
jgi:formate dehydrogenase maturation protein FdhE